ncbi:ferric-rhodotorulic acid/ferric-coprogen receptor FhuE [Chimaeribacter californicus]|uniref:Ferric-rhodotorulic acid/ferric-coprogen receptor FhuE n=1 Tax=Chimaeribacter californicus TaxID=2060067 RepID=A0A2N5DV19_9GAMM|nr:ferric-rhodotorulic acid/ferric-coprogen receptor FhuE [Chimaeribacter californicus]PLR30828.1 ferric-rhodotorulic acid/ferric-coprogen receptor FhuE [Chimaeribacter californicus]
MSLLISASFTFAHAADDTLVVTAQDESGTGSSQQDYSVPITSAGTKMSMVPRDIPQSVSIISQQRMQDQDLQTIGEVMTNTTGITASNIDSDRSDYYSRGFLINNYLFDDIPTTISNLWNFGDAGSDTAIYQRIEVVRGATGLMTGTGNPSAAINMVRKHADSREFQGSVSGSYGSWDKQRLVTDLSAPLTESGNVRGRVIAGYQDNDTWLDRYHTRKKFLYGTLDADLTESTTLSLGYDYQESKTDDPTWGGLPTWYSDGSRTHYDRETNPAPDWSYSNHESKKVFADLTQRFSNGWQARLNGTHAESDFDSRLMYASGFPDKTTGSGVNAYGGWNKGKRKVDSVDTYATGPFELFNRTHELMVGGSYSRQNNHYFNSQSMLSEAEIGNYNQWDGSVADPVWSDWVDYSNDTIRQKSLYAATRLSLADPLSLIVGARYTGWRAEGSTATSDKSDVTPYAGLVYDINDTWSAYASYTSIFQPQTVRDSGGRYLDPVTGKNYEAGLKADWYNGRLTASFAVFRIEQDNVAQSEDTYIPGTTETAYRAADGTVSKGVEFEVNGALTDRWQMTFGGTRYIAKDSDNNDINAFLPRTSLKLFTRYQLPMLPDLTVGGGVNWQNHTWEEADGPLGTQRADQGSYALVSLFGRYQVTRQFSVQANVNNLFDKTYYDYLAPYAVYGAPRSVSVTANYTF